MGESGMVVRTIVYRSTYIPLPHSTLYLKRISLKQKKEEENEAILFKVLFFFNKEADATLQFVPLLFTVFS